MVLSTRQDTCVLVPPLSVAPRASTCAQKGRADSSRSGLCAGGRVRVGWGVGRFGGQCENPRGCPNTPL